MIEILIIKEQIEKHYKVKTQFHKGKLIIDVPVKIGLTKKEDKIDYVEDLMKQIVDGVRQHKAVFDVECDMTYESITISFIG